MKKITYYCDRCKGLISGKIFRLNTVFGDPDVQETEWITEEGAELCEECFRIVDDFTMAAIRDIPWPEKQPGGVTEKPKKQPRKQTTKKEIDMPKVMALRKAGWSLEKIGEEFSCTAQTIANHITAYQQAADKEGLNEGRREEDHGAGI